MEDSATGANVKNLWIAVYNVGGVRRNSNVFFFQAEDGIRGTEL